MYQSFETERLILKPTTEEDAEFIFLLVNSPKWLKYIGDRNVKSPGDAQAYIRNRMSAQLERIGFSSYTVFRKTDMKPMGTCGLYDRDGLEGIDIGFAFLPEYEGQGYAFESVQKLKAAATEIFKIPEIKAITTKDNIASQRLLEKLEMKKSGTIVLPNDKEELLVYSLRLSHP